VNARDDYEVAGHNHHTMPKKTQAMANTSPTIVVAGDLTIDWLQTAVPAIDPAPGHPLLNWQLHAGTCMTARPGGALLLARFVAQATGQPVVTHRLDDLENTPPSRAIHSIVELAPFPYTADRKDAKNLVYRVKRFGGFAGPTDGPPEVVPIANDDPAAGLVVIDDAGNGFRDESQRWPRALSGGEPSIILKMSRPLAAGPLWEALRKSHAERLVVVISADDLRAIGVQISRRLSWERTAKEFVWQLASNPALSALANCRHLVVRFGVDGAIYYRQGESRLYFDAAGVEDDFADGCPGGMLGLASAFTAALAESVSRGGLDAVGDGVRGGIRAARRILREGFGKSIDRLDYQVERVFQAASDAAIYDVLIPRPNAPEPADPNFWCILNDLNIARLEDIAYAVVTQGDAASLHGVPEGRFRHLRTVDRAEVEAYRGIRNLLREYLAVESPKRPLSVAVFGPPGSGKSFGVTEVAESVAPGKVERLEFNVSQFGSAVDLVSALHRVRDSALGGNVPLVFFDEFDSSHLGRLGWLKSFLAPMQDGAFKDGESMHPVGKSIFVFAGGTSSTFEEFCREAPGQVEDAAGLREFRDAKGPDFVSRLRGYVNVLGPNPASENDHFYVVRRAMLLRSLIERKARHILDNSGRARVDAGVLRAFIKVPRYKHGARSVEAILDMSMLAGRHAFEQAALPAAEQMRLHVDADIFWRLVVRDVLFGSARELLGKTIHEQYLEDQKAKRSADDIVMQSWVRLSEDLKESNRRQADHIPEKLRRIGCGYAPVTGRKPELLKLSAAEIETISEMEHDRFVAERRLAGWTLGPRDPAKKQTPDLIPWSELDDAVKEIDRQAVRRIPDLLARAGFEIYRL
jgi:hypothetical protein